MRARLLRFAVLAALVALAARSARGDDDSPNYTVPAIETAGITLVMLGWNNVVGSAPWARVDSATVGRNLSTPWVLDQDRFWINQIGHPAQGVFPYSVARSSGVDFWRSGLYPFAASAVWEIAGETTLPSINDQVTTTVAGMVLGEALHRISGMILEGGSSPWRIAAATVFAPLETGNRLLLRTAPEQESQRSRFVAQFGGRALDAGSDPRPRATVVPDIGARLTYGIPGDPSLELERPFDRFELEASYSAEIDPVASVFGRGVVAGSTFDAGAVRGLTGVVLQFDFTALGHMPASTSAIGVTAEARWELGPRVALEGTAVASAVILGATGFLPDRDEHQRTYRIGPGGQGELGLELRALDRVAARVGARQYAIVGMGGPPGIERITYASGSLLLRLFGNHGIGGELLYGYREADRDFGSVASDAARVVRVFYAVGNDDMTR
jgi:hypothetical protein